MTRTVTRMGWTPKKISIWCYLEYYVDDDDVRLIKGTEERRWVKVLVKDGKELKDGNISLQSLL